MLRHLYFLNFGGEIDTKGIFFQQRGPFQIESGTWFHEGEINIISGGFINKGQLNWKNVIFNPHKQCHDASYELRGECTFDNVTVSDGNFKFCNFGDLYLKNPSSSFMEILSNQGNIILNSGQYIAKNIMKLGRVSLIETVFTITDNPSNPAPNRLLVTESDYLGQIQSDRTLKIELQKISPNLAGLKAPNIVTLANPLQSFDELAQAQATILTATLIGGVISKNYVFDNLLFLNLYYKGNLSIPFEIKIRSGCFDIEGILSFGTSNDNMGTLAATEGSLTVSAHEIDARWGKIFGFGPTQLTATKGDLICGQAISKAGFGTMGRLHQYNDRTGNIYANVNYYETNGAYIASNSTLKLKGNNLLLDYGQVKCNDNARFEANNKISAIRTIIQGSGTAHWVAPMIYIGCAAVQHGKMYVVPWYPNEDAYALKSYPTEIHFNDSIWFDTMDFTNYGSKITTRGSAFFKHNGSFLDIINPINRPATFKIQHCVAHNTGSYAPILQSADLIQIQMGDCIITGSINSLNFSVYTQGNTLIHSTSGGRTAPSRPQIYNITDIFTQYARIDGLCQLTQHGEIQTEFPMGAPYQHPQAQTLKLVTQYNNPPVSCGMNPVNVINPLRHLPSNMFNLWLQKVMGEQTGKVHVRGGVRDNNLALTFWQNNETLHKNIQHEFLTPEEVTRHTREMMLLEGLQQVGNALHQMTYLAIPPHEFNDAPGISGDVVEIENDGNLTIQDADITAKEKLDVYAHKNLLVESTVQTYHHDHGSYLVIGNPTSLTCTDGPASVVGREGFQMRGASLEAAEEITVGSTEGPSSITNVQMVRTDVHTHHKDGGWFGKDKTTTEIRTTVTSRPSTITSSNNTVTLLSGKDKETTVLGSHVRANKPIIFKGGKSTIGASVGYNTMSTETIAEGLFSKSRSTSRQSIPVVFSSSLQAPLIQFLTEGNPVVITGSDIITLVFDASMAGQVSCSPTVGRMSYFQQATGRSFLARHDVGCSGYEDVARPTRIQANKIILNMDPALKHVMTSVDWHPEAIEIIGHYAKKTIHLDRQHHQWAHHHQTIPAPVVQVLAMAAAYFSGGAGLFLGNAIAGASTLGSVVIQAGVQALCAQFAGSFASHGDPIQAWKDVSSPKSLESIGVAMASAGALQSIAPMVKVNMAPGQTDVLANLQKFGLKNMVNAGCYMLIQGERPNLALRSALRQTAIQTAGAFGAHQIGIHMDDSLVNTLTHGGFGAGLSYAMGENPWEGAASAMLAKVLALNFVDKQSILDEIKQEGHAPKDREKVFAEKRQDRFQKIQLITALAIALAGGSPVHADFISGNLLEHNCGTTQCVFPLPRGGKSQVMELLDENEEEEGKAKSLIQYIYGDADDGDSVNPKATDRFKGQRAPKEGILEWRASRAPFKPNRQQGWITMETPLEKARISVEEFMGHFYDIGNKSFTELKAHEYFGVLPLYTLKGIGYLDSCIGSPLSQFGQKLHNHAQDFGNLFRDGTFYMTGNYGFSQDIGYGFELGIKTAAALTPLKFFKGPKTSVVSQYTFQNELTVQILKDIQKVQYKSLGNQNRIPFVKKLDNWGHIAEDITFGKLTVLGEQSGTYLSHIRTSYGYDAYLQSLRCGSEKWMHHHQGSYVVGVHGAENGVYLTKFVVNKPNNYLTLESLSKNPISYSLETATTGHRLLAKMIKKDHDFSKNRFVTLLSCDTGKADFAQNLANSLGAPVLAPTELIWANSEGILMIGKTKKGKISLDLHQLGQFKLFSPGNHQLIPSSVKTSVESIILNSEMCPLDALSKRLKSMRNNPKGDWKIADFQYIAERYGITYRQNSTSHVTFTYPNLKQVVAPARKPMKPVYIRQFLDMIDSVVAQQTK